ncbi:MAG TPA: hypothetical protein VLV83_11250 [Acidobacteriota bacterium]|nr:hypothetical protein [Acidobacteriota bacterium]
MSVAFRGLNSNKHYNGTERQFEREELGNFVQNNQRLVDVVASYAVTDRLSLSVGVPYVNASWSIPLPVRPVPGPRSKQEARGIGDVSVSGRYWLMDTEQSNHNVSVGLGIKMPTGKSDVADVYPDLTGENPTRKAVDQSIQPGDGGWGILAEVHGFKRVKRTTLFASLSYLMNPKNTNDTPSIVEGLGLGDLPRFEDVLVNSVPDQYVLRGGAAVPLPVTGLSASLALRMEGLPRYDLFGASNGWRRPGREVFIEPGFAYSRENYTVTLNVPLAVYRNRLANPNTDNPGDATFPDQIFLVGFTYRFD